ncbi:lysosomal thioesterase PPT2 homolog [Anopheles ziemanni]|uniref:lysosomal thioesterase PPT2 homolog n=1 Tax=Anopheles coustani TaxID=139045 RepID=UPI00265984F1|nr:lysosomal thioesterase PPT2 homolog [Anopheles coustani]XP_058178887.1 lysosomal thioesterase PPT2 homolog [Anopheles ziemanni]
MITIPKLLFLCLEISISLAYRPVFIYHGILTGADSMHHLVSRIQEVHPETAVYNFQRFGGWSSLENAWHQVFEANTNLRSICTAHPEGINMIGYSQGGLLGRAVLQTYPDHCVKTFISLSSPQAGQFGDDFLHLIFPSLVAKTAYQLFYTYLGQHTSVGNYWNDPHHQDLFEEYSIFLPYINNRIYSTNSTQFRDTLMRLDRLVLVGGPDDGVITPWQSSHFSFYNETYDVVPLQESTIYTEDLIGLKTLADSGRLHVITREGVYHYEWHRSDDVIDSVIMPYLD